MNKLKIVKIGDVVMYKTTSEERKKMESMPNCNVQMMLPAIVVAVWGQECVNLNVICDGEMMLWKTSSPKGDGEMCWNWPEIEEIKDVEVTTIEKEGTTEAPEIIPSTSDDNAGKRFEFAFVASINKEIVRPIILAESKEAACLEFERVYPLCSIIECNQVD